MQDSKRCPKCGETKPLSEYYSNKRRASGVQTYCIECTRGYMAARQRAKKPDTREFAQRSMVKGKCQHPDGCDLPIRSRGLCNMHHQRLWATGELGPVKALRRSNGSGSLDPKGYRVVSVNGKRMYEHRYVMEMMLGRPLFEFENVHHKNGRRDDNRPLNLELWVKPQLAGQRVEDLVRFVADHYREATESALRGDSQLKL